LLTDPAQPLVDHPRVAGLLLAAGAGQRYGQPKALVDSGSGSWVQRGVQALAACDPIVVVLGARSVEVAALVPTGVRIVVNPDFADGMGSSLRVGLTALVNGALANETEPARSIPSAGELPLGRPPAGVTLEQSIDAALVMLVDLPGIGQAVINRVLAAVGSSSEARSCLARAAYDGVPGHPVLLGFDHWSEVKARAVGDRGARDYLRSRRVTLIECGDIGSGEDVDRPG